MSSIMFGLGFGEIVVIMLIALVFLGPEKIPETAKTLGKWFYEIKRSLDDVKEAFDKDVKAPVTKEIKNILPTKVDQKENSQDDKPLSS